MFACRGRGRARSPCSHRCGQGCASRALSPIHRPWPAPLTVTIAWLISRHVPAVLPPGSVDSFSGLMLHASYGRERDGLPRVHVELTVLLENWSSPSTPT